MNIKEIKEKIKEAELQINALKESLSILFDVNLAALMKEKDVIRIKIHINNHEFNDGDATYFSLYYEDLTITLSDGREQGSYGENKDLESLRKEFVNFFSEFQDIFEDKFGEAYESVAFTLKENKLNWE